MEKPVAFFPRKQRYSATEAEGLATVETVNHFMMYLIGKPFTIETDHKALEFLDSSKATAGRLARWALRLQPTYASSWLQKRLCRWAISVGLGNLNNPNGWPSAFRRRGCYTLSPRHKNIYAVPCHSLVCTWLIWITKLLIHPLSYFTLYCHIFCFHPGPSSGGLFLTSVQLRRIL